MVQEFGGVGNYKSLARIFVDGKIQDRFTRMAEAVQKFIDEVGPELQNLSLVITQLYDEPLRDVKALNVQDVFRQDLSSAKKFLSIYNRLFGTLDHNLALMASNFGLPEFLETNGCSRDMIGYIQKCVGKYWNQTYGTLIKKFSTIKADIDDMRVSLTKQMEIMEALGRVNYYEGLQKSADVKTWFDKEKSIFFERLVVHAKVDDAELQKVRATYIRSKEKLRGSIISILKNSREDFASDWGSHQGKLAKSIIATTYLVGFYKQLRLTRKKWTARGIGKTLRLIRSKLSGEDKELSATGDKLSASSDFVFAGQLGPGSVDALINSLEELANS
tara:strand:+ start:7558 stop:8553 length:996 start_codon:yes stop_codon:yes gene_type:complete